MSRKDRSCADDQTTRRPRGVNILVTVQLLQGFALLGNGTYLILRNGWPGVSAPAEQASRLSSLFEILTSGAGQLIFSLPVLFIAISLFRLKRGVWMAAMALQGLGLALLLFAYAIEQPNYPAMLLGIVLVFYLNQQDVQIAFHVYRGTI